MLLLRRRRRQGKQDYSRDKKFGFRKKEARNSNPANSYRTHSGDQQLPKKNPASSVWALPSIDLQFGCSGHSLNPHGTGAPSMMQKGRNLRI